MAHELRTERRRQMHRLLLCKTPHEVAIGRVGEARIYRSDGVREGLQLHVYLATGAFF